MRLSKLMDSLNFSMMGSVAPEKRPPVAKRPPRAPDDAGSEDDDMFSNGMSSRMVFVVIAICLYFMNGSHER